MMRKVLILLLTLVLLGGMLGCQKKTPATVSPNQPSGGDVQSPAANATQPTTPTAPPTGKDLYIPEKGVMWSTIYPEINSQVELKITVINQGTEAVDGFDYNVRITKDGTEWKDETKTYGGTLYPGNKTRLELLYTFTSEGKYRAEVYVDKDNKLNEKSRFNNVGLSFEISAMKPTSTPAKGSDGTDDTSDLESPDSGTGSCSDTDSGKDEYTKGVCDDGVVVFGNGDYCMNSNTVKEYYCDTDGRCKTENIDCDDGCDDNSGVCI